MRSLADAEDDARGRMRPALWGFFLTLHTLALHNDGRVEGNFGEIGAACGEYRGNGAFHKLVELADLGLVDLESTSPHSAIVIFN